ncbi:uncharacterized protein LOC135388989 [Ornithodoros turicata]|uniref:uncharacterized protein LOC135388989 n=1 Tax=Ornithodoros turicata TaxID=34597 RepID=UPI0031389A05
MSNSQDMLITSSCHRCFLVKSSRDHVVVVPSGSGSQDYHRLLPSLFRDVSTISTKSLLKLVHELSSMLTEHSLLMRSLGTPKDGLLHRSRMGCLQSRACQMIHCMKVHFTDTFRSMEVLSRADLADLGKAFRIYLACLHSLEQDLRQAFSLFQLFPLHPTPDGTVKPQFVHTGATGGMEQMFSAVCESLLLSTTEQFRQERESWKQLEKLIKDIKLLDLSLHMDSVLGPIVDYVIFHPEIAESSNLRLLNPMSTASSQESIAIKEKPACRLLCLVFSIFLVVCIGAGVMMAVFFLIFS